MIATLYYDQARRIDLEDLDKPLRLLRLSCGRSSWVEVGTIGWSDGKNQDPVLFWKTKARRPVYDRPRRTATPPGKVAASAA